MDFEYREWEKVYFHVRADYQTLRKTNYTAPAANVKELSERVAALEKALQVMKDSPMQYELAASELARRQIIVENLKRNVGLLTTADSKAKLLATPAGSSSAPSSASGSTTINPLNASDRALIQRQMDVMKMQDDILLDIEKGVDRLHGQAVAIKDETIEQNKILDNLDEHVDEATAGLKKETAHAELIRRKTNDCYLYVCIVVEIAILLILVLLMFI